MASRVNLKPSLIQPDLITSLSNGLLAHLTSDPEGSYIVSTTWPAHSFEPWIVTWDHWNENTIWSGKFLYSRYQID